MFFGHLNINSIRNKFEALELFVKENFDIFLVSESKLDSSFPDTQFSISGYRTIRKDRNKNGGGLMFFVNENKLSLF